MALFTGSKFGFGKAAGGGGGSDSAFQATGGTKTTPGNGYIYHFFTIPGTFTVTSGGSESPAVNYLVIGGGGAGGNGPDTGSYMSAGGGGAGAFVSNTITANSFSNTGYGVVVGTAGPVVNPASPSPTAPYPGKTGWYGMPGGNSTFNAPGANGITAVTAAGGGGGGGSTNDATGKVGQSGGSAGGGGLYQGAPVPIAGTGDPKPGPATPSLTPAVGWGNDSTGNAGGSGAGEVGPGTIGGYGLPAFSGDTGIPPSYGTPGPGPGRYFAGGGGMGTPNTSAPDIHAGGYGGGGAGGYLVSGTGRHGTPGTANTGSGGGGCGKDTYTNIEANGIGGTGAAGIVIIKYSV